jgi:hypothetical protein
MAIENLISLELSADEQKKLDEALLTSTMRHPKNFPKIFCQKEVRLICALEL